MYQNTIARFNAIAFTIITIICALLPFFFLPASVGGLGAVKGIVLYSGVFLAFSFWLVAQFLDGSVKIPKHWALVALGLWVVFALISALTSANTTLSLWGRGFVIDSFATVLVFTLFTFMIASFAREQHKLIKLFLAAFVGSVLTVFLQVVLYVFGSTAFVSQYLAHVATAGTLVGPWVDFAYFVIFTFLMSLLMFEVLAPKGFFRFLSLFAMILSIITLIFLNFKAAWIITIIFSLLVFVYKSSVERSLSGSTPVLDNGDVPQQIVRKQTGSFPYMSFISLLVGLFFLLASNSIGATLAQYAGVTFTDIRPSFSTTTNVMRSTLAQDPLFGAGAGRYGDMWNLYHPTEINQTMFWNTSFDTGYSLLQSFLTTNGILTVLFLVLALGISLVHGFKLFNYQFPDRFSRFIAVSSLIMLIAFVCLIVFASPGIVLVAFGFMYLALLIGVSTLVGRTKLISLNYLRDPRLSFFAILILVLAAMAGFSAVFFSGNRFASIIVYNRALAAADFETASRRIDRALSLSQNDIYWRTRTVLHTSQFSKLANAENAENADKAQLQTSFTQAEQSAQAAVSWDSGAANNWLTLSQVYQLVVDTENAEAYTNAKQAADEAQKRNPSNPLLQLNQAQLAYRKQDVQGALGYIAQAITLKADYLDAYLLRGQIKRAAGDTAAIKNELLTYTGIARFDPQGYALLGQAELELKNYQDALNAFAIARELSPNDPNVHLQYIGTLEAMGSRSQAVEELKAFKIRFPSVEGVDDQIARIQNSSSQVTTPTPPQTVTE